jgi:hypothetical protein
MNGNYEIALAQGELLLAVTVRHLEADATGDAALEALTTGQANGIRSYLRAMGFDDLATALGPDRTLAQKQAALACFEEAGPEASGGYVSSPAMPGEPSGFWNKWGVLLLGLGGVFVVGNLLKRR